MCVSIAHVFVDWLECSFCGTYLTLAVIWHFHVEGLDCEDLGRLRYYFALFSQHLSALLLSKVHKFYIFWLSWFNYYIIHWTTCIHITCSSTSKGLIFVDRFMGYWTHPLIISISMWNLNREAHLILFARCWSSDDCILPMIQIFIKLRNFWRPTLWHNRYSGLLRNIGLLYHRSILRGMLWIGTVSILLGLNLLC